MNINPLPAILRGGFLYKSSLRKAEMDGTMAALLKNLDFIVEFLEEENSKLFFKKGVNCMFIHYKPWRPDRLNAIVRHARTDLLALDVQLGSACNARCPRCDSSCSIKNKPAALDIEAVSALAAEINQRRLSLGIPDGNMGFCCGLGEPTFDVNLTKLKSLIANTAVHDFSWSIFNNGIYWDGELEDFLRQGYLNVLVQYNSERPEVVAKMLGVSPTLAAKHMENRRHLLEIAGEFNCDCATSIGASIVPERDNYDEVVDIVRRCVEHNVFPLVGELENAGYSKDEHYEQHKLTDEELAVLYRAIERQFGVSYKVPFCPAAIGAININSDNEVTVDSTGLSCGWYGMGDPRPIVIGDIRKMTYKEIVCAVLDYRAERIPEVRRVINDYPDMVFGGCGGNARDLLTAYVSLYDNGVI